MGQLSYNYQTPEGVAGSLLDIRPYAIDSRINDEEAVGATQFGMGVMQGSNPGVGVLKPTEDMTADKFEGMLLTGFTQQMDMSGNVHVMPKQAVGVLRYGAGWARIAANITPAYGEKAYLIVKGDEAGLFTNDDGDGENLDVNCRFIGSLGTGATAPIEIFNQAPNV